MVSSEREMVRSWLANLTIEARRDLWECGSSHPDRQSHTCLTELSCNSEHLHRPVEYSDHANSPLQAAWAYLSEHRGIVVSTLEFRCCELVWGSGYDHQMAANILGVDRNRVRRAIKSAASVIRGRMSKEGDTLHSMEQLSLFGHAETADAVDVDMASVKRPMNRLASFIRGRVHRDGAELVSMVQGQLPFDMEAV